MKLTSLILFTFLLQIPGISYCAVDHPGTLSKQWFYPESDEEIKGTALVIHGLNLKPDKMESIIAFLNKEGVAVCNLSLRGHGDNYLRKKEKNEEEARLAAFKTVSYKLWYNETLAAYAKVKEVSDRQGVPLFFIGFSFGGLIGCDLLASRADVRFDRMALLAPALSIRTRNYIIKLLSPFSSLVIPSFSLESYQANHGTPVAAYNAFFKTLVHFEMHLDKKINIPTIVFIEKRDEFVSQVGLMDLVIKNELDQWEIHVLEKSKNNPRARPYHLIIDEQRTGPELWRQITDGVLSHFLLEK